MAGNKRGEVVGPAGGVTGVPRCLAEVYINCSQQFISKKIIPKLIFPIMGSVKRKYYIKTHPNHLINYFRCLPPKLNR